MVVAFAREDVPVYPGAAKPLIRPARSDPEIHGVDGLGGVRGLPDAQHAAVAGLAQAARSRRAIDGMTQATKKAIASGRKITFVTTGPTTNLALFVSAYPDLVPAIEEIVFMGGGVGLGNRSAVAGVYTAQPLSRLAPHSQSQSSISSVIVSTVVYIWLPLT